MVTGKVGGVLCSHLVGKYSYKEGKDCRREGNLTTLKRKCIIDDLKGHGRQQARLRLHFVGGGKSSCLFLKASTFLCETWDIQF